MCYENDIRCPICMERISSGRYCELCEELAASEANEFFMKQKDIAKRYRIDFAEYIDLVKDKLFDMEV